MPSHQSQIEANNKKIEELKKENEKLEAGVWPKHGEHVFVWHVNSLESRVQEASFDAMSKYNAFMLSLGLCQKTPEAVQTVLSYLQETVKAAGRVPQTGDQALEWNGEVGVNLNAPKFSQCLAFDPSTDQAQSYAKVQAEFYRVMRGQ